MTLRRLLRMAEGRRRHDWRMVASIRAGLANGELKHPQRRLWTEDDFDPHARSGRRRGNALPLDREGLLSWRRMLFRFGGG